MTPERRKQLEEVCRNIIVEERSEKMDTAVDVLAAFAKAEHERCAGIADEHVCKRWSECCDCTGTIACLIRELED